MITYAQYFWNRYMSERGQGLTEYAIILLLVVLIGMAIYFGTGMMDIKSQLISIYSKIGSDMNSMATSSPGAQ